MTSPAAATPGPTVHLRLHGVAHWRHGNGALQALERKHAALLAWLWVEGPTPRSRLAGLLWPQASEERARGNLRQRLLKLRQEVGDLLDDRAGVLSLKAAVPVDPPDPPGARLLHALAFDDCDAFARWLDGQHEAARERRKREWLAEVRDAASSQRLDDALYAADQLLQADRESEEAYRVLMEVSYLRGDHAAALNAWDRCRDMLRQLYGVQPSAATQQLGQTLLQAAQQAQAAQAAWAPTPAMQLPLPPSVLRPPRLVGRRAELQALVDGWHAGHVLVVTGVAGVGKSRLLADWQGTLAEPAPAAAAGSTPALPSPAATAAAARPGDAVLPYASLSRLLLSALDRFAPALDSPHALQAARLLPRLATLAGVTVEPVRTDYERTQALLALAQLLGDCARSGCRAFVLDDLQFADPPSLAALRVLADPLPSRTALRFALGVRADEAGADAAALLQGLADSAACTRVDLQPLPADDAAELLHSLALRALDAGRWAPQIWQQVGGNPAFLLESVKLLLSTTADGPLPLPATIEAVIERRIELLSPRARHLAQLAALAGSSYSVPLAAAALACAPLELGEPLRELERRQVFHGRQFVHDVIAGVTERSVPPTVAEFMHRFVAEHLQSHGGDAAHIATHWLACGEWCLAGRAFHAAARAAGAAALANEQAALLDRAVAAFEHDPAAHDDLFTALEERANVFESTDHEGLRPGFIARLRTLARSEAQQLSVLNHHNGWLANLAQPIEESAIEQGIPRALAVGRPDLAWHLARMLGLHRAMTNRADEGLRLMAEHEDWITHHAGAAERLLYRVARSSAFAFGDRLAQALEEGHRAVAAATEAQDWPQALPAMSNVGVMHYWRGEYAQADEVLTRARAIRERLYGSRGSGIKIDIHLGAVRYERGQVGEARALLEGALAEMRHWPDNEYRRTECLLADNHLAQMFIALGQRDEAAAVLAHDASGVADRFLGRRLALRLRWQRMFGRIEPAQVAELQALAARVSSPFNRVLMELELCRLQPPDAALAFLQTLPARAEVAQRPGLQLHVAALACRAHRALQQPRDAERVRALGQDLLERCSPFDMARSEACELLQALSPARSAPAPS
jgi:DNA-binding SARP family transcriptional activator